MKRWWVLGCMILLGVTSNAQLDRWWTHYHYRGNPDLEQKSIWFEANADLSSNRISNTITGQIRSGGKISLAQTAYLSQRDPAGVTRLGGGVEGGMWYRSYGSSRLHWHVGAGMTDRLYGSMRTGLAQLVLTGNGVYEDQTLSLGPSWFRYLSAQYIGGGVDLETDGLILGVLGKVIKASRWHEVDIESGSFYTAPYGTSLEADLTGSQFYTSSDQSKLSAWYGTGGSLSFFMINRPAPGKMLVSAQVQDLGFIHFGGGKKQDVLVDTIFTGLDATTLLESGAQLNAQGLDSIEALLNLKSTATSRAVFYPGNLQLDMIKPLGEKFSLAFQVRQAFVAIPPKVRLGLRISAGEWLGLEPYFIAGGLSRIHTGFTASIHPGSRLQLMIAYGLIESQIAPNSSTTQTLNLRLNVLL